MEARTPVDGEHAEPAEDEAYHGSVDDEFRSVLEGLRTTLPGTQALFGFLLILPFQPGFGELSSTERAAFYIAFVSAALATILLVAPSAHQRFRAPRSGIQRRSEAHLRVTVWVTIAGTVVLAVALAASVYLVSEFVLSSAIAAVAIGAVTLIMAVTWFYLPLVTFERME